MDQDAPAPGGTDAVQDAALVEETRLGPGREDQDEKENSCQEA
jgi:hypothetical protein